MYTVCVSKDRGTSRPSFTVFEEIRHHLEAPWTAWPSGWEQAFPGMDVVLLYVSSVYASEPFLPSFYQ